ncbi:unnamed protein product [Peniophora sp. CBMAI 1063]|nr:unnamed protein product [Peniophora sp. CBMAI 1063]
MHRLGGTLAHSPAASSPSLALSSTSTLVPSSTANADNPWGALHVLVLPLFNSEPLRVPIEDLNSLVRKHISTVVSNAPQKALLTLENETADLLAAGMDTINAKLQGVVEEKLLARVVELWGFFWDQVLPYVEGVLLPLQTDPLLSSLYRTQKSHRGSSPTRTNGKGSFSMQGYTPALSTAHIDVRTLALRCFRDRIILPVFPRLHARISLQKSDGGPGASPVDGHTFPRLQQMLLVLVSQARRPPASVSLTAPAPQPLPGEAAAAHLLRLVRSPTSPSPALAKSNSRAARTLSFLSGNVPRDRRGRIGRRPQSLRLDSTPSQSATEESEDDDEAAGGETPRTGFAPAPTHAKRVRDLQMLESLRSPDAPDSATTQPAGKGGGWGLDESGWDDEGQEDEDEATMDWDQAQAAVERMVGIRPPEQSAAQTRPEGRRRMT